MTELLCFWKSDILEWFSLWFLQLDRPFNSSEAVQAVQYLRADGTNPGINAEVETAGWGSLDDLGSRPDKLKEVVIEVVSSARCKRSDYFGRKFTSNMMCAHKICSDPCNQPHKKDDSCDVSFNYFSFSKCKCWNCSVVNKWDWQQFSVCQVISNCLH